MNWIGYLWGALLMLLASPVMAAPMDALTTANAPEEGKLELEVAYDAVNSTLDFLNLRAQDDQYGNTTVGDYSGYHAIAEYGLTNRVSLEGGFWERKIINPGETATINSWKLSSQYRFYGNDAPVDLALRVGAWGNYSGTLKKMTPTRVLGKMVQTVTIDSPTDMQYQADLIGTWALSPEIEWSVFDGVGTSRVEVAGMSATATSGECNFNLSFTPTSVITTLATPCGSLVSLTLITPTTALQEFSYDSTYNQAGTMLQWHPAGWKISAGYLYRKLRRENIDRLVIERGGVSYETNHIVTMEIIKSFTENIAVFASGQLMGNQFVGEIPFSYNTMTASKFNRLYGYATFGFVISM